MNPDTREDGFTLVELLVVILIIGVLAAIAVPAFLEQRKNAYTAALKSDLRNTSIAVNTYIADKAGDADIQPSELYTHIGERFSQGTDVLIFGGQDNWCLVGVNWNSTADSYDPSDLGTADNGLLFDSTKGGLQPNGTDIWSGECITGYDGVVDTPDADVNDPARQIKSLNHWLEQINSIGEEATAQEAAAAIANGR